MSKVSTTSGACWNGGSAIGRDGREVARAVVPIDWDSEEAISIVERVLYTAP